MDPLALCAKRVVAQWLAGFREACCLHRVVLYCNRSRALSIRTGQCFLLNGLIFLGSLFILNSVVIPILLWILPSQCEQIGSQHLCGHEAAMAFYSFLRFILVKLFYIFWFYPLYVFSIVLSTIWYNDIAKHAFNVRIEGPSKDQTTNDNDPSDARSGTQMGRPGGLDGVILGVGEQIYSVLLLTFFFIEVLTAGYIPYIGKAVNFLLLSWMYAYYCFEYKWNHSEVTLDKRLDFFESNWPFFSGFGSPCVLAIFFFSPLVSYGVMSILYPLFVLTAAGTQAEQVIDSLKESWGGGPRKLQIFDAANALSLLVLQFFPGAKRTLIRQATTRRNPRSF